MIAPIKRREFISLLGGAADGRSRCARSSRRKPQESVLCKVLRCTNLAELPIERPTKFETVLSNEAGAPRRRPLRREPAYSRTPVGGGDVATLGT